MAMILKTTATYGNSGTQVTTSGDYLAIGRQYDGTYGQVQIMKVNIDGDWNNHQLLEPTTDQVGSGSGYATGNFQFGYRVDMSGNYLIVTTSQLGIDGNGMRPNCAALFYKLNTSTDQWEFEYQIRANDLPEYNYTFNRIGKGFGINCCINSDRTDPTAFVSDKCGFSNNWNGFIYVFVRNSTGPVWELKAIFSNVAFDQNTRLGQYISTSGNHFVSAMPAANILCYWNLETPHAKGTSSGVASGSPITTATPTITTILNGGHNTTNYTFAGTTNPMNGPVNTNWNININTGGFIGNSMDVRGNYICVNTNSSTTRFKIYTIDSSNLVLDKEFSDSELGESLLGGNNFPAKSGLEWCRLIVSSNGVYMAACASANSKFVVVLKRSTPDISTAGASWAIKGYYIGTSTYFGGYGMALNERTLCVRDNNGSVYFLQGFAPSIKEDEFLGHFGLTDETVLSTLKTSVLALTLTPAVINLQSFSGQDLRITSGTAEQKHTKRKSLMGIIFSYNLSLNNFRVSTSYLGLDASNFGDKQNITAVRKGQIADVRQYTDAATGWYSTMENDGDTVTIRPQFGADFVVTKAGSQYKVSSTGKIVITASSNTGTLPNGTYVNTTDVGYLVDTETVTINGEPLVFGSVGGEGNDGSGAGADPYVTTLDGTFYKLDNINGCCRMLQGTLNNKNLIINVEMLKDSEIEELEMNNWSKSLERFKLLRSKRNFDQFEQSFFTKIYVEYGDSQFSYDIMKSEILLAEGNEIEMNNDNITNTGSILPMYKNDTVKNTVELYCDNMCIRIMRYNNKQLRSEIDILGGRNVENRYGFVTSPMNTDICKVNSLTDTRLIEKGDIPEFRKQIEEVFDTIDDKHNRSKMIFLVNCY